MIHSTFSPASMSREQLERTFVQREGLAKRLVDLFTESALSESKHHVLLVGPRGIGKSHLVSLVYHRLKSRDDLKNRLIIAYLREDEWGISSFLDLLAHILRAVGADTTELMHLPSSSVEARAWALLQQRVVGKTLLVILENLDTVLRNLGDQGQKKWRSLIQTNPCWAVLATTPALSADVSKQASPFYGFFEIHNLDGLSFSEAIVLLRQLALSQGNEKVADYVVSPAGRARIRAVQHLANGNHRIFIIFYDFLVTGLDQELVEPLLKTIDALTPYYQSQMKDLSPQQRKLVEFLCEYAIAVNVKTIASRCFVSHQTAASQLKQLLEGRYVRVTRTGRESFYELNEPLMRVCVEAKCHNGEPIRLLVEFLRYWFSRQELEEKLAFTLSDFSKRAYFEAALREYDNPRGHHHLDPVVGRLCVHLGLISERRRHDKNGLTAAAQELAEVSKIADDWSHYTLALSFLGGARQALGLLLQEAEKRPTDARILRALAEAHRDSDQPSEALAVLEKAITLTPRDVELWMTRGIVLERLEKHVDAFNAYSQASALDKKYLPALLAKSRVLSKMDRHDEAQRILKPLLNRGRSIPGVFTAYGGALANAGRVSQALGYFQKQTERFPEDQEGWTLKGRALLDLNRPGEALVALERAMKIGPSDFKIRVLCCKALFALQRYGRALRQLPVEVVAHWVFHECLELHASSGGKNAIRAKVSHLQSRLKGDLGTEAILGGLVEFASNASRQIPASELAPLRVWSEVVSELFGKQPRFAMLIKVFDAMVRYKESGDEKVLLQLPLEQRKLLLGAESERRV